MKWFKKTCKEANENLDDVNFEKQIDDKNISKVTALGFPLDVIRDTIEKKKPNQIFSCLNSLD